MILSTAYIQIHISPQLLITFYFLPCFDDAGSLARQHFFFYRGYVPSLLKYIRIASQCSFVYPTCNNVLPIFEKWFI